MQSWRGEPVHPTLLRALVEPRVTCVSRLWLDLRSGTQALAPACAGTQLIAVY